MEGIKNISNETSEIRSFLKPEEAERFITRRVNMTFCDHYTNSIVKTEEVIVPFGFYIKGEDCDGIPTSFSSEECVACCDKAIHDLSLLFFADRAGKPIVNKTAIPQQEPAPFSPHTEFSITTVLECDEDRLVSFSKRIGTCIGHPGNNPDVFKLSLFNVTHEEVHRLALDGNKQAHNILDSIVCDGDNHYEQFRMWESQPFALTYEGVLDTLYTYTGKKYGNFIKSNPYGVEVRSTYARLNIIMESLRRGCLSSEEGKRNFYFVHEVDSDHLKYCEIFLSKYFNNTIPDVTNITQYSAEDVTQISRKTTELSSFQSLNESELRISTDNYSDILSALFKKTTTQTLVNTTPIHFPEAETTYWEMAYKACTHPLFVGIFSIIGWSVAGYVYDSIHSMYYRCNGNKCNSFCGLESLPFCFLVKGALIKRNYSKLAQTERSALEQMAVTAKNAIFTGAHDQNREYNKVLFRNTTLFLTGNEEMRRAVRDVEARISDRRLVASQQPLMRQVV